MPVLILAVSCLLVVLILRGLWPSDRHGEGTRKVLSTLGRGTISAGSFIWNTVKYAVQNRPKPQRKNRGRKKQPQQVVAPTEEVRVTDIFDTAGGTLIIKYHETGKYLIGDFTEEGDPISFIVTPRWFEDKGWVLIAHDPFILEE